MTRARIAGTGSYLPEKVLTNLDLEKFLDTSDEWIRTRTGIRERRVAADGEFTSDLAARAGQRALEMAGVRAEDLDLIVVGTITGDFPWPATACLVQNKLGAARAFAYDVSAACSGFVFALDAAVSKIEAGKAKRALVIGAEILTRAIDWQDRNTCVLFGDGAGAVILEAAEGPAGFFPPTCIPMAPIGSFSTSLASAPVIPLRRKDCSNDSLFSKCRETRSLKSLYAPFQKWPLKLSRQMV
jgi:3-oxoacyl-[acyl-carrier-protein] synthase-3